MAGHCGVNSCMKRWRFLATDKCPRCGAYESAQHVWFCQSVQADARFDAELATLRTWLSGQHTHRELVFVIMTALEQLRAGTSFRFDATFQHPGMADLVEAQTQIGWKGLTQGHKGMWENRNEVNNSVDNVTFVDGLAKLNAEVRMEYTRGRPSVLTSEHHLFKTSLSSLLQKSPTYRKWWIDTVRLSQRQKRRKEQSSSMDASRRIMAAFLLGPNN